VVRVGYLHAEDGLFHARETFPLVDVLGFAGDGREALQDVDDVVEATALDPQLLCARVQTYQAVGFGSIHAEELAAQLAETLLLSTVARTKSRHGSALVQPYGFIMKRSYSSAGRFSRSILKMGSGDDAEVAVASGTLLGYEPRDGDSTLALIESVQ
jgi:hypothetical protein